MKSSLRTPLRHTLIAAVIASAGPLQNAAAWAASPSGLDSLLAAEAAGRGVDRAEALRYAADDPASHWHAGQVRLEDRWVAVDELSASPESRELKEYQELRERTARDVDGHRLLASWAKKRGLAEQAVAHWNAVLSIDPDDAAAREALGHERVGGVWFSPEEVAEAEDSRRRELVLLKRWMPQMRRLTKMLQSRDPAKKLAAVEELESIDADAAVALEYTALQVGDDAAMPIVAALGRMRSEEACRSLVNIALADPTGKAGRAATDALRDYDPHFYVPDLLELLQVPTEVRAEKLYTRNGDLVLQQVYLSETRDAKYEQTVRKLITLNLRAPRVTDGSIAAAQPASGGATALRETPDVDVTRMRAFLGTAQDRNADLAVSSLADLKIERDSREAAERHRANADVERRAKLVLSRVSGVPAEASTKDHWQWWPAYNERGTGYDKPVHRTSVDDYRDPIALPSTLPPLAVSHECLVAGTLIQTSCGLRPVESIKVGDVVAAVDVETGEVSLKPVNVVNSRTAERTFVIRSAAGEAVEATGGHRWWVLGEGWVRTRDLEPAMRIRTARSSVEVAAVEASEDDKQVFNLVVDGSHTYFVGRERWLSWDVTELEPTVLTVPGFQPQLAAR